MKDESNMKSVPVKLTKKQKVAQLRYAIKSDIQWGFMKDRVVEEFKR